MSHRIAAALVVAAAVAAAVALLLPGVGSSKPAQFTLVGTVGPGFSISLRDESGAAVNHLDAGTYTIHVSDMAPEHNFALRGPGVSEATTPEFVGDVTWTVTITDGNYTYRCDVHPTTMKGSFTGGNVTSPPPPPPVQRLVGSVGPGKSISLKTSAGRKARTVAAGTYRVSVRDRSKTYNFHLSGPGVNRKTTARFKGTATWRVVLRAEKTYRYRSDTGPKSLRGTVKVR
jgi:hypothetical protein